MFIYQQVICPEVCADKFFLLETKFFLNISHYYCLVVQLAYKIIIYLCIICNYQVVLANFNKTIIVVKILLTWIWRFLAFQQKESQYLLICI